MLDVHSPEHPISGWKDFGLHLVTITVGLLIAIGLEQSVEAVHHRHQRREAEQQIRRELKEDRASVVQAQANIQQEIKMMLRVLTFLQTRGQGKPGDAAGLNLNFSEGPLQDSAWQTAASTGVLTYMDYDEVQRFSLAYKEQAQFEALEQQALDEYLQLDSFVVQGFDPQHIDADDMKAALPEVRRALAHLMGMMDISRGVLEADDKALK